MRWRRGTIKMCAVRVETIKMCAVQVETIKMCAIRVETSVNPTAAHHYFRDGHSFWWHANAIDMEVWHTETYNNPFNRITQNNQHLWRTLFEMFPEIHSTNTSFHFKQHSRLQNGTMNNQNFWRKKELPLIHQICQSFLSHGKCLYQCATGTYICKSVSQQNIH